MVTFSIVVLLRALNARRTKILYAEPSPTGRSSLLTLCFGFGTAFGAPVVFTKPLFTDSTPCLSFLLAFVFSCFFFPFVVFSFFAASASSSFFLSSSAAAAAAAYDVRDTWSCLRSKYPKEFSKHINEKLPVYFPSSPWSEKIWKCFLQRGPSAQRLVFFTKIFPELERAFSPSTTQSRTISSD